MSGEKAESIPIRKQYQSRLDDSPEYKFKLIFDNKKSLRNGLLLIFLGIFFGAGAGAIIDLIYLYTNITNEYAIMGIGSGIGALLGLTLGLILINFLLNASHFLRFYKHSKSIFWSFFPYTKVFPVKLL